MEHEKYIQCDIDILDILINCDEKIFKIDIDNIVHNAIKYSPNNEIIKAYREKNKIVVENSIKGNLDSIDNLCEPLQEERMQRKRRLMVMDWDYQ